MKISTALQAKAERLVAEDRITHVKGMVYRVAGDSGTWTVMLSDPEVASGRCDCPRRRNAGLYCSHILAASIFALTSEPEPSTYVGDPFAGLNEGETIMPQPELAHCPTCGTHAQVFVRTTRLVCKACR